MSIGNGQSLVSFIFGRALGTGSLAQIPAIYADLGEQVRKGMLPFTRLFTRASAWACIFHGHLHARITPRRVQRLRSIRAPGAGDGDGGITLTLSERRLPS